MADDEVFAIRLDFAHRTGGKRASIRSAVGDYHLNTELCTTILAANGWELPILSRLAYIRSGHADSKRSLAVEMLRRRVVRELVQTIGEAVDECAGKRIPAYQIVEMLTGWVLHERNDPPHEKAVATLRRTASAPPTPATPPSPFVDPPHVVSPFEEARDGSGDVAAFSWDTSRDMLFPVELFRNNVLPGDVGRRVVMKSSAARTTSSRQAHELFALVNPWRGKLRPVVSGAAAAENTTCEAELVDLELETPTPHVLDILLPSPELNARGSSTAVFVRVSKWCVEKANAANASDRITAATRAAREKLLAEARVAQAPAPVTFEQAVGEIAGEPVDIMEIRCGSLRCPILLRAWHKMRALYRATNSEFRGLPTEHDEDELFARRLLVVLLRYASLSGAAVQSADQTAGFHASVPPKIYALLRERLSCTVEGFASPMNSTSTAFCSLFPDVDSYFGSMGSFFSLSMRRDFPNGISMTCNPPYSVVVMMRVPDHLGQMFAEADELDVPLQVFVVVCNWAGAGSTESGSKILDKLRNHSYCKRHVSIEPSRAPFQDGHAFVLNRPFFTLGSNTELFLFQNEAAHRKWPTNRDTDFPFVVDAWMNIDVKAAAENDDDESGGAKRRRDPEDVGEGPK